MNVMDVLLSILSWLFIGMVVLGAAIIVLVIVIGVWKGLQQVFQKPRREEFIQEALDASADRPDTFMAGAQWAWSVLDKK